MSTTSSPPTSPLVIAPHTFYSSLYSRCSTLGSFSLLPPSISGFRSITPNALPVPEDSSGRDQGLKYLPMFFSSVGQPFLPSGEFRTRTLQVFSSDASSTRLCTFDCTLLHYSPFTNFHNKQIRYGIIFPSTGANSDYPIPQTCITVGVVGSFEAFVGVLYAGFCTAVLFGKVIRSQSQAQVYFSDPLVVRFGKEELSPGDKKRQGNIPRGNIAAVESRDLETGETLASIEESVIVDAQGDDNVNIPCPSLEFRLVNRLHDIDDGEIVEARLDCVAILDSKLCQADTFDSIDPAPSHDSPQDGKEPPSSSDDLTQLMMEQHKALFHNPNSKKPRVLTKLSLDANEHPFFRRVWFGRHRLDENSPLLTQSARNKIKQNGGYWPSEWNHARGIRNNLHFRHLLVCLSGTSNANATSVYAQKVYDLVDVNVGYRFVPMNYHTPSGALKTDAYLLNAICEQRGGGGEPFL
eukprot:CCRYP_012084-RB/>CCRYP_012084-RB protein AED:0.04 eAED:0.04 QI:630/1/1/1/1/0.66/3/74/465